MLCDAVTPTPRGPVNRVTRAGTRAGANKTRSEHWNPSRNGRKSVRGGGR